MPRLENGMRTQQGLRPDLERLKPDTADHAEQLARKRLEAEHSKTVSNTHEDFFCPPFPTFSSTHATQLLLRHALYWTATMVKCLRYRVCSTGCKS